jgi:hypothetical protein
VKEEQQQQQQFNLTLPGYYFFDSTTI